MNISSIVYTWVRVRVSQALSCDDESLAKSIILSKAISNKEISSYPYTIDLCFIIITMRMMQNIKITLVQTVSSLRQTVS